MKKFEEMKYRRPSLEKIKKDLLQIIENFKNADSFKTQNEVLKKIL